MTIRFFFPYRAPSGVCSAFARVADDLASRGKAQVAVLDYPDGYLRKSLSGTAPVRVEEFADGRAAPVRAGEVLVLQASSPSCLRREFQVHPEARLVLWQLHPLNFIPNLIPLVANGSWLARRPGVYRALLSGCQGPKRRRMIGFINLLTRHRALFFYEQPSVRLTEQLLGCTIPDPILLPVPVAVPAAAGRRAALPGGALQVAWVGRLYDFKIHILVHTLQRFSTYARQSGQLITFHVIGDGPERARLDRLHLEHPLFQIHRVGDLPPSDLAGFLAEHVDLVAAMGTSALEGALVGLPTLLLDLSYGPVPRGYRFRWLFDTPGFDLGHAITPDDCDPSADVLPGMMEALRRDYTVLGGRCFDYCTRNHGLAQVTDRFLELVESSSLRFADLPGELLHKSFSRRVYERLRQPSTA